MKNLPIKVQYLYKQSIQFYLTSAIKNVLLSEGLYKSLPLQRVHQRYEVARIKAEVKKDPDPQNDGVDILTEVKKQSKNEEYKDQFNQHSLFFWNSDYKLADLQSYLVTQNIPTTIVDKFLNYDNKVYIYFDEEGRIRLEGFIGKEYYAIRQMIYYHFGRI
mmetsp:Transcript_19033/g.18157  ORF Transcript_19033/g.18157 Transcript_19033/m.18157 type:complete len:161 (-) Transcript_19033:28-510(-)